MAPSSVNRQGHPLSRTYGIILQSSLTTVLPSALDFSSRLPVSVLVRSATLQPLEDFLGRPSDDFEIECSRAKPCRTGADFPIPLTWLSPQTPLIRLITFRTPSPHRSTPPAQEY